jgi:hypothetical protein
MRNESVKTMTMCAIMAALMCILGPMSIPIGAVPISFTNLVIYLTVYLLGAKKGCISYLIYMLLGGWTSCIFWLYRRYCKAGRPDRRLSCRIYSACLNQRNCSGKDKQKHCLELCWYGSRNSNCLSVWNSLVCNPGTVYSRLCIKRVCNAIYPI